VITKRAFLIIDVQQGMFDPVDPFYRNEELLATLGALLARARMNDVPVLFMQHCDDMEGKPLYPASPGWAIHPAIAPLAREPVIPKHHPDSFQDTRLAAELQQRSIEHLVIAGLQSEYCVDTTCRRAYSLGYKVTLVKDGHSTWNSKILSAEQIIAHHNRTLDKTFASVKPASQIFTAEPTTSP